MGEVTNAFHDLVDAKRIVREIKLLRFLKHDNIIRIRDVYATRAAVARLNL